MGESGKRKRGMSQGRRLYVLKVFIEYPLNQEAHKALHCHVDSTCLLIARADP